MKQVKASTTTENGKNYLQSSKTPIEDIALVSYAKQPANKRMYMSGYEDFFNKVPVLNPGEKNIEAKFNETKNVIDALADVLKIAPWLTSYHTPNNEFHRHIIGIEPPVTGSMFGDYMNGSIYVKKQGKEFIVAHWGDGFISPVHGHMSGLEIEEMLIGKLIVNRYNLVDENNGVVRLASSTLYEGRKTIEFAYTESDENDKFERQQLIHNFISIGESSSLHYVPEHSKDGNGNTFTVQYFEDLYKLTPNDVTMLTLEQGLALKVGDVALVRSKNVPDFKDHFIVITGGLVVKPHGIRPKDLVLIAKNQSQQLLEVFDKENGWDEPFIGHIYLPTPSSDLILLKLNDEMAKKFIEFHNITIEVQEETFDDAYDLTINDVKRITTEQGMNLRKLDVLLVRSKGVPDLGDHYILITGHSVEKNHGIRPQTAIFPSVPNSALLDVFDGAGENVILLKLNDWAKKQFLEFYGIDLDNDMNVISTNHKLEMV